MLDHHIQRSIVYRLAFENGLRFSELQPEEIENKLFDYHLKKVIVAGFVKKSDEGLYELTSKGRKLGVHATNNGQALVDQAYSVLFLVIRRKSDDAWLLYRRKTHPLINRSGFMHVVPNATENIIKTAKVAVLESTGLDCDFTSLGGGYFRIYEKDQLESFTHYSLLYCESASGELMQNNKFAEYFWAEQIDMKDSTLLPNMRLLLERYQAKVPFISDDKIVL